MMLEAIVRGLVADYVWAELDLRTGALFQARTQYQIELEISAQNALLARRWKALTFSCCAMQAALSDRLLPTWSRRAVNSGVRRACFHDQPVEHATVVSEESPHRRHGHLLQTLRARRIGARSVSPPTLPKRSSNQERRPMIRSLSLTVLFSAAVLAGCAGGPTPPPLSTSVILYGVAPNTAHARAHLIDRGSTTDELLDVSRTPAFASLPAHYYSYVIQGSCANPGPTAYRAADRVLGGSGFPTVRNSFPVGLNQLSAVPSALVVRSSPADGDMLLFCGDLRAS
jgi:hypothetical protein